MKKISFFILILLIITLTPIVTFADNTVYRALLIGNNNYKDGNNLKGPSEDSIKMENAMRNNYFSKDNKTFSKIVKKRDLTKAQMIQSINESFKGAKESDVSYFYYSGHGLFSPTSNSSKLVGVDGMGLDTHELERELSKIPGKVVVILDSCNSGGFINKSTENSNIKSLNEKYNDAVIDAFTSKKSKSYLTSDKYKVLTASSKDQETYEYKFEDGWGGVFTRGLVDGIGYNESFLADKDLDGFVTLSEIYDYTKERVKDSNVQVYPENDNFIVASSFSEENMKDNLLNWTTFDNIALDKVWKINFNQKITESDWNNKVYILDSNGVEVKTKVMRNADGKSLSVTPLENYQSNSKYSLWIEDNIFSESGKQHKHRVLVVFNTLKIPDSTEDYGREYLNIVENGHFYNYRFPLPTVGLAFTNFFSNSKWDYFKSTDNFDIVEFTGDAIKDEVYGIVTIQFSVDLLDKSFQIDYIDFDGIAVDEEDLDSLIEAVYSGYSSSKSSSDLKDIFEKTSDKKQNHKLTAKKLKN